MKRILTVLLTLCMLCTVPVVHADVDYQADYEAALALAGNDLTNAQNLQEAMDILQRLGGYQLSRSYLLYFQALADLATESPDMETDGMCISIVREAPAFVTDLAERGYPSCEEIGQYMEARGMEIREDLAGAYDLFKVMTILDAPIRAFNLRKQINEKASTVSVVFRTEDGTSLDQYTATIAKGGEQTVSAKTFEGYVLADGSPDSVTVTVDALGRQSHSEVVFVYRKLPDGATVPVEYRTDTGSILGSEEVIIERGQSQTFQAKTFDDYTLTSASSVMVTVDDQGEPSQAEVVFTYKGIPDYATVTVICRSDSGETIREDQYSIAKGTIRTFEAPVIEGYELWATAENNTVKVDNKGVADRSRVVFTFRRSISDAASFRTVGNYVRFGHYPQESYENKEPIEWLVLAVSGNKVLLISHYALDAKPYNTEQTQVTWETCTLRKWLNSDFLDTAFSVKEQSAILLTDVDNSFGQGIGSEVDSGRNTKDKVFLLSYAEASGYLGVTVNDNENLRSRVAPTPYAYHNGAERYAKKTDEGKNAGWWWLRSPGSRYGYTADVTSSGNLGERAVNQRYGVVRPAIWIDLDADIFR